MFEQPLQSTGLDDPKLQLPPGSFGAPVIGEVRQFSADPMAFAWERYRAHGPVFKTFLGAPLVLMMGPEANRFILHDAGRHLSVAKAWPKYVSIMFGEDNYSLKDGEPMRRLKSLTAAAFHPDTLSQTVATINRLADEYLASWSARGEVELFPEARMLVFEAIWEWIAGPQGGAEERKALRQLYHLFTVVPDARIQGASSEDQEAARRQRWAKLIAKSKLQKSLQSVIAARRQQSAHDVLSVWLGVRSDTGGITEAEMVSQSLMFTVAGGDATASALTWIVHALQRYPEVRARLRREIDAVLGGDEYSFGQEKQMPYLLWFLKEIERFYSPAFGSVRKVVEPFQFGGYDIPAGWNLRTCNFISHRLPHVFKDPDTFDPERFAPGRDEDKRTPYSLVGFGAGPRQCSGKPYALVFLAALTAKLVRRYEWDLSPDQDTQPVLYNRAVFVPRHRLRVCFRRQAATPPQSTETIQESQV